MKKTTTRSKWAKFMITPAEFFVFGLAGFVIWVAKVQDGKMEDNGYSENHFPPKYRTPAPYLATAAYFPSYSFGTTSARSDAEDASFVDLSNTDLNPNGLAPESVITAQKALFMRNYDALIHLQANNLKDEDRTIMMRDGCITYDFIEESFQLVSNKSVDQMVINEVLANPVMSGHIFKAIHERFGVPQAESKMFAKNPLMMLSDWALFVAQSQR
jgi:hypothetical protein